ncbi:DUF2516 family protein [Corynebacterium vitaeruminis]|nr:DUF2516 family protein [Corynebacterium vitaeruminis]
MMALLFQIGSIILALSGLVAAVLAGITRDDAFEAADRQNKWIWVSMLALSALMVWLRFPFLSWIGLVIIGLYWFDVRPQIKDLLSGNGGWR